MAVLDLHYVNAKLDFPDVKIKLQADKLEKYPAKQHARAVATKLGVHSGLLVLSGEKTQLLKDSDQSVPFRQRRYFYYLSGCSESDCFVTYDIAKDLLVLYIPKVDLRHAVWGGAGSTKSEAYAKYDVDVVEYTSELKNGISAFINRPKGKGKVYLDGRCDGNGMPGFDVASPAFPKDRIDADRLKGVIDLCRVIKFPHEVELIKRANEISAKAHCAVLESIRHFESERQVEGVFLNTCISEGAHNQSYSIIAGAGSNAAVLHYIANDAPFKDSQVLLLDAGAEFNCYASDVTRTFPISGYWSKEAKDIYDAVNDMQAQCIARIQPGVHFRDLQILSMAIAVRWLLKLGILHNGSLEEILRAGTIRAFFPHGLGHHVGLEVHDVLNVPIQSKTAAGRSAINMKTFLDTELASFAAPMIAELYQTLIDPEFCMNPVLVDSPVLEPGMVVTVEPGLYFSDFALSKVYLRDPNHAKYINKDVLLKYMPVGGIRIEDDILVTKKGYSNLTTAPKGDEALKVIRGEQSQNNVVDLKLHKSKEKAELSKLGLESTSADIPDDSLTKCSIDVKKEMIDCLPPSDTSKSLIRSFPFVTPNLPDAQEKGNSEELLTRTIEPRAGHQVDDTALIKSCQAGYDILQIRDEGMLHNVLTKKLGNNWAANEVGQSPSTNSHAFQKSQEPSMNKIPQVASFARSVAERLLAGTGHETRQSFASGRSSISSGHAWPAPFALSQNQEKVLSALREAGDQSLAVERLANDVRLSLELVRIAINHLTDRALVCKTHTIGSVDYYSAIRRSPYEAIIAQTRPRLDEGDERASAPPGPAPPLTASSVSLPYQVKAMYSFDEPNDKDTLSLRAGDVIEIARRSSSGWCYGKNQRSGVSGWLPENYVRRIDVTKPQDESKSARQQDKHKKREQQAVQIRRIATMARLRSVLNDKLSSALLPANSTLEQEFKLSLDHALRGIFDGHQVCFSGLCMHLKNKLPAIDFASLPGSGIDKFRKIYETVDEAVAAEFSPGHVFYRMTQDESEALFRSRWALLGVQQQLKEELGICGTCVICRQGFQHWDEKWLENGEDDEDDDEEEE